MDKGIACVWDKADTKRVRFFLFFFFSFYLQTLQQLCSLYCSLPAAGPMQVDGHRHMNGFSASGCAALHRRDVQAVMSAFSPLSNSSHQVWEGAWAGKCRAHSKRVLQCLCLSKCTPRLQLLNNSGFLICSCVGTWLGDRLTVGLWSWWSFPTKMILDSNPTWALVGMKTPH